MQPKNVALPSDHDVSRRRAYHLLIVIAAAMGLGRILSTVDVIEPNLYLKYEDRIRGRKYYKPERPKPTPTFGSNDRSRWSTVRALVDHGTYVVGERNPELPKDERDSGIIFEDGWTSVDKVLHPETNKFYSTKPPLYPTIIAGEYWILKHVFGLSISDSQDRWIVFRVLLITFNLIPFVIYLVLLSRLVERLGTTDWARLFIMGSACFGTMMTPFLISINNHTVAACSAMIALYATASIFLAPRENDRSTASRWCFVCAGFFAGFTACNELPATALLAGLFFVLAWSYPARAFLIFLPSALVPVGAYFLTNYLAVGDWVPIQARFGTIWYKYDGSHWSTAKEDMSGIDWAGDKESRAAYAFHFLIGHHGLFSLMPIFLIAAAASVWGAFTAILGSLRAKRKRVQSDLDPANAAAEVEPAVRSASKLWAWHSLCTLVLSTVVIGFYLVKSDNYGGWTNGPRWLTWLTPFWLLAMLPLVDRLSRSRTGRIIACLLLLLSIMAMSYRPWNPWRHPWIYNWMDARGLIPYYQ